MKPRNDFATVTKLVEENLGLAFDVMREFKLDDHWERRSVALRGLQRAAEQYDPLRHPKFHPLACRCIRNALSQVWVKERTQRRGGHLRDKLVSLDVELEHGDTGYAFVEDENAVIPDQLFCWLEQQADTKRLVRQAVQRLRPLWWQVVVLYYGLNGLPPQTVTEVARLLHISHQRVSQVLALAHDQLRRVILEQTREDQQQAA